MNPDGVRGAGRLTKSGFKSILASVLIIAMLLSTMGGATYSWFSDSYTSSVEVGTGTVDYIIDVKCSYSCIDGNNPYNVVSRIDVTYTNVGTLPITVVSSFRAEVYGVNGNYYCRDPEENTEIFKKIEGSNLGSGTLDNIGVTKVITPKSKPIVCEFDSDTINLMQYNENSKEYEGEKIKVKNNGSLSSVEVYYKTRWDSQSFDIVTLACSSSVTRSYGISFLDTIEDRRPMDGIPLQFYTVGYQPDYEDYKQSTTDTAGISHEEKAIEASICQIEESAEVDLDSHSESPSDSKWIPEADVFDSAIIGKEEESDPRSAQYAQSSIDRHSGSDADAPKAVAP